MYPFSMWVPNPSAIFLERVSAQHDDGDMPKRAVLFQALHQRQPVAARHGHIGDDDVGVELERHPVAVIG